MPDAGTIGDIFAMRVHALGGAGVITDGALRDTPAITAIELPVYHQSSHAATYGRHHMPYSVDDSITCAGVFVQPGDIIVGDAEGAVVIPHALGGRGRCRCSRPGGGRGVRHRTCRSRRIDRRPVPPRQGRADRSSKRGRRAARERPPFDQHPRPQPPHRDPRRHSHRTAHRVERDRTVRPGHPPRPRHRSRTRSPTSSAMSARCSTPPARPGTTSPR